MKKFEDLWKARNYHELFIALQKENYQYTIENFVRDFAKINSENKFCYIVYLLSKDYSVENILLLCDFLMYTDTFFYDIHSVIKMVIQNATDKLPMNEAILKWVVAAYDGHPDSPFTVSEMDTFKIKLSIFQ